MPTTRVRINRGITPDVLTPAAIAAWVSGDFHALNAALAIRPWQPSPFDVRNPDPPDYAIGMPHGDGWPRAWALRQALLEVAGEPSRMDRHGRPLGQLVPFRR